MKAERYCRENATLATEPIVCVHAFQLIYASQGMDILRAFERKPFQLLRNTYLVQYDLVIC